MLKTKRCSVCGLLFRTSYAAKYCSCECRHIAKLRREKTYNSMKIIQDNTKNNKDKKSKENNLVELNTKARDLGMTYGQYMGLQYAKKNPIMRTWY